MYIIYGNNKIKTTRKKPKMKKKVEINYENKTYQIQGQNKTGNKKDLW